ncbi:MAG: type II toxin-antitoxin system VapC family toxin [Actinomycetota bacterium]
MIAYFDTSAIVPLLVAEPTTDHCTRFWDEATRIVSVRLLYPEACAALARAVRMERLTTDQMVSATAGLDGLVEQIDFLEITADLARDAGRRAQEHGLRGYDAVHLAAGVAIADTDVVFVTGDALLGHAAKENGLATAVPTPRPT